MNRFVLAIAKSVLRRMLARLAKTPSLSDKIDYPLIVFNDHIGKQVMIDGFYEYKLLVNSIHLFDFDTKATNMIDVGANIGNHSVFFHKYFKQVYAFEPQKRTYQVLYLNALPYDNIKTFNYGLSNVDEKVLFLIPKQNNGEAREALDNIKNCYQEEVHLRRFDDLLRLDFGFVKIDVEGNEYRVFKGMKKQLQINKPIIALEYNGENKDLAIEELRNLGYNNFFVFATELKKGLFAKLINLRTESELRRIELPSKQNFSMCFAQCDSSKYRVSKSLIMP